VEAGQRAGLLLALIYALIPFMDTQLLLLIALCVCSGAVVQAMIGFGGGLVAIPLLLWAGLDLPDALGVMTASVSMQLTFKVARYWAEIDWPVIWPMARARAVGYVPGLVVLSILAESSQSFIKQVIGGVVLIALIMQLMARITPRDRVAAGWTWLAGTTSGFSAGCVGIGGPPVVLWVMAHNWPPKKARLYLWTTFWVLMPLGMVPMLFMFDTKRMLIHMGIGAAMTPLVLLGTSVGLFVGHRIPARQLRWSMIALLVVLGVWSILGPMV